MNDEARSILEQAVIDLTATISHGDARRSQLAQDLADVEATLVVQRARLAALEAALLPPA